MTQYQDLDEHAVREWIRSQVEDDLPQLELTNAARDRLEGGDPDFNDLLYLLRHVQQIKRDYPGGCYTARGLDVDGRSVSAVIAAPSSKNRIRIVKVWRH